MSNIANKKLLTEKGFTLIEIIIVLAMIGVLAGLFVANYPASQRRARDTQRISDLRQYQTALEVYANANDGKYPDTSGNLSDICNSELDTSTCPENPRDLANYGYRYDSGDYYVYAELEQPSDDGDTRYQFFCSNGKSGDTVDNPASNDPC